MRLFSPTEAKHFCASFSSSHGAPTDLLATIAVGSSKFREGTSDFDRVRALLLRQAERYVFLGWSNFRRSFDLLVPSSAGWMYTTLYYCSFYFANGLLNMFGGWVSSNGKRVLEVGFGAPGSQLLRAAAAKPTFNGTHERFWEHFYASVPALLPWVPAPARIGLQPVSANVKWLTETRNKYNYEPGAAVRVAGEVEQKFVPAHFPATLGQLSTLYGVAHSLSVALSTLVPAVGLTTDALDGMSARGSVADRVRLSIWEESQASVVIPPSPT